MRYLEERGEVGIDYRMVPPDDAQLPDGWPKIKPNEKGVQMFVYKGMVDYMRRVSATVTIGRAFKGEAREVPRFKIIILRRRCTLRMPRPWHPECSLPPFLHFFL